MKKILSLLAALVVFSAPALAEPGINYPDSSSGEERYITLCWYDGVEAVPLFAEPNGNDYLLVEIGRAAKVVHERLAFTEGRWMNWYYVYVDGGLHGWVMYRNIC